MTTGRPLLLLAQVGLGVLLLEALSRAGLTGRLTSAPALRVIIIYAVAATVVTAASVALVETAVWIVFIAACMGAVALGAILRRRDSK